jgi:hypothetical protein
LKTLPPEEPHWTTKVAEWQANHFTISDPEANAPRLLRKVARAIEELGAVDVLDIVFCDELEGRSLECKMTVYFVFGEANSASSSHSAENTPP